MGTFAGGTLSEAARGAPPHHDVQGLQSPWSVLVVAGGGYLRQTTENRGGIPLQPRPAHTVVDPETV